MGEKQNQPFQLPFNTSLKIDFQGSRVTSDGESGARDEELHPEGSKGGNRVYTGLESGAQKGNPGLMLRRAEAAPSAPLRGVCDAE